jgi:hypothetical protein
MLKHAQIINAAWLYSQVQKKRIISNLKKPGLTDFGRCHYLLQLGHYTEMGDLAEPYKNFLFPLEMLIEGSADEGELATLKHCKAFLREYRRELKAFYQAGGTKVMPERLVSFLREVHSRPPQLKGNEKGVKILHFIQEAPEESPDIYFGDCADYKFINSIFQKAADSRIEYILALFSQIDSLARIDITQPVPQLRRAIQDRMDNFRDLLLGE